MNNNEGCTKYRPVARQIRGTCWIYSILNIFLLSDIGARIVFTQLMNKPSNNRNRGVFGLFSSYYCLFSGGPTRLNARNATTQLLINIRNAKSFNVKPSYAAPKNAGNNGLFGMNCGRPIQGSSRFLRVLGFTPTTERRGEAGHFFEYDGVHRPRRDAAEIVLQTKFNTPSFFNGLRETLFPNSKPTLPGYTVFGASILISRKNIKSGRDPHTHHSIAGFICGRSGYIVDSNYTLDPIRCRWWIPRELNTCLKKISEPYKRYSANKANFVFQSITTMFYINNTVLDTLKHPVCAIGNGVPRTVNTGRRVRSVQEEQEFNNLLENINVRFGNSPSPVPVRVPSLPAVRRPGLKMKPR
jgi:hypothetical protein